ncbi:pentapeptide repeat-containing protein [Desertifilum sp. FACHB-1129]|uniref:DNA/RNA helicase n=1 Tax=Desertifilum tharense IPPAS B-1220 TaxID=1781255 RepID=A0A1E5QM46_9CYAN|nr:MULTISPECIES: pentapeptide repeat-containing protein [Desertifilum]MDA0213383.1 pentapeptide repeat-containing protein [Cyanobacteria bacterium FC1]MBD2313679.1 pentapeptide repeat-containing protein [Desertifilum sp. FACHB-1129]MBD2324807.1 pentapeptide repeat-containing protein [Desertifilum sp. FACHB-866]MBD2334945.1 pentapeptide repeat-containing protein [Desertifilum sp. FACHB-868]OEJ75710.1 DNA/RNA helicase [Desertifilum tharense IPPAS B-1220]
MQNRQFIATEPIGKSGERGEQQVWDSVQLSFARRRCFGYWRYPIFSQTGETRKEPDILIFDRELGIIAIEVKSLQIDQIVGINGHCWIVKDFYTETLNPYEQAERHLFAVLQYCDREPTLHQKVPGRAMVALPYISQAQWRERGFDQLPSNPPILFQDDLPCLFSRIQQFPCVVSARSPIEQQWILLQSAIAGTALYYPNQSDRWRLYSPQSRADILAKTRQYLHQLDIQQERIGKAIPPGAQRIRGIAGSGKTVLLCQKAAQMHLKYPDWDIAFVFFNRSLYHPITAQIDRWLRHFSNQQVGYSPQTSKLKVLHAWGAKNQPGLYSLLCQEAKVSRMVVNDTSSRKPQEALAEACWHLLREKAIPQIFDAILIDEGQDFLVNEALKFHDKQPFYWMAYQALRPVDIVRPEQRRLIWAYDEVQSLESLKCPTAREILGAELSHLVTGIHPGGIPKSETLKKCYRTPGLILTLAHAVGMGLLRPGGMLTGMIQVSDWQALGYQVQGQFLPGQEITLKRPPENSPNPISQLWQEAIIHFQACRFRQEEFIQLYQNILQNLKQDGLKPSRDILVLVLGSNFDAIKLQVEVASFLISQGIDVYLPGTPDCNILKSDPHNSDPNQFWCEGGITISRIHQAKGQEADMVYLIGLDGIAKNEQDLTLRNQLFVALTRSRAWVSLSGIGRYPFYQEVQQAIASGDTLKFTFQRPPQRELHLTALGELLQAYAKGSRHFPNLELEKVSLVDVDLSGAHLVDGQFFQADFSGANLAGANLAIANLSQANLSRVNLQKSKLVGANLTHANLTQANLYRADLSHANLTGAQFRGANLEKANLTGANLREVDLSEANLKAADFTDAIL